MITEQEARRLLHEAVDGVEAAPGALGAIRAGRTRRTRRRWLTVGVGLAAATAAAVIAVTLAGTSSPKNQSLKVLAPPAVNGWTPIVESAGPAGSLKVFTGHEFVAAGECCSTDARPDLHAYDPVARRWRDLPPTPLSPRGAPVGVWTGKEVVVVGGSGFDPSGGFGERPDGAAFDPVTGGWSAIAAAPEGFSSQSAAAVWTGKEILVWRTGGSQSAIGDELVMAYDPSTDSWRKLPPSGLSLRTEAAVAWTGKDLFVWGGDDGTHPKLRDGALLDPATGTWTPVADPPIVSRADAAAVATPAGVFVWGGSGPNGEQLADGAIYNPPTNSWRTIPAAPMAGSNNARAAWTGHEVFVAGQHFDMATAVDSLSTGAFNPATSTWQAVPPPRAGDPQTRHLIEYVGWTGTDVLLVQRAMPSINGVSNVADDRLDGFTWTPGAASSPSRSATTIADTTTAGLPTQACGTVPFTSTASSQGAFNVTAVGTDCTTALSVAGASKGHNGDAYTFNGFTCPQASQSPPTGIELWTYRCTSGVAEVDFDEQG
ncbi:MAG: hypothetical protein JOZ37_01280 [Actinobacteria bacterium]|nr:hypothetical protein [Actinomycetota bacterium]